MQVTQRFRQLMCKVFGHPRTKGVPMPEMPSHRIYQCPRCGIVKAKRRIAK